MRTNVYYNPGWIKLDIQAYVNAENISLREFSRRCKVHNSQISRFMSDEQLLGLDTLMRVCMFLEKPLSEYVESKDNAALFMLCHAVENKEKKG